MTTENWRESINNTDPGDRTDWILALLYAPNDRGEPMPIFGDTRMMKACFLLDRKLEEFFDVETDFDFQADKYGPFDKGVYIALEYLEDAGLIEKTPEDKHDERYESAKYSLTPDGRAKAREFYEELTDDQQKLIRWVKYEHAMKRLGQLLTFVYNQYPDYTTESVLT